MRCLKKRPASVPRPGPNVFAASRLITRPNVIDSEIGRSQRFGAGLDTGPYDPYGRLWLCSRRAENRRRCDSRRLARQSRGRRGRSIVV